MSRLVPEALKIAVGEGVVVILEVDSSALAGNCLSNAPAAFLTAILFYVAPIATSAGTPSIESTLDSRPVDTTYSSAANVANAATSPDGCAFKTGFRLETGGRTTNFVPTVKHIIASQSSSQQLLFAETSDFPSKHLDYLGFIPRPTLETLAAWSRVGLCGGSVCIDWARLSNHWARDSPWDPGQPFEREGTCPLVWLERVRAISESQHDLSKTGTRRLGNRDGGCLLHKRRPAFDVSTSTCNNILVKIRRRVPACLPALVEPHSLNNSAVQGLLDAMLGRGMMIRRQHSGLPRSFVDMISTDGIYQSKPASPVPISEVGLTDHVLVSPGLGPV
ncbi:hypothetical protein CMUS01_03548 [Colletotrichum musicola]|uniref:Uncharacterized protein n=1 Tax=Colletotrichum musicola TaxID=2175873 RepID=A0A8H6U6A5_9PEZI|nr:hypothetical protein CMUS01_03548 [Colletotrichum musicola]